ncbi:proline-rich protein 36-like [Triplophysa rosa]|uniref:proline-rich protein 36-like n=1 Tax=Triplophysa rosa TaxID=992332 RepID=UPI0025462109|nr:proline-rich protein 36-like [Triplophysa rosa]
MTDPNQNPAGSKMNGTASSSRSAQARLLLGFRQGNYRNREFAGAFSAVAETAEFNEAELKTIFNCCLTQRLTPSEKRLLGPLGFAAMVRFVANRDDPGGGVPRGTSTSRSITPEGLDLTAAARGDSVPSGLSSTVPVHSGGAGSEREGGDPGMTSADSSAAELPPVPTDSPRSMDPVVWRRRERRSGGAPSPVQPASSPVLPASGPVVLPASIPVVLPMSCPASSPVQPASSPVQPASCPVSSPVQPASSPMQPASSLVSSLVSSHVSTLVSSPVVQPASSPVVQPVSSPVIQPAFQPASSPAQPAFQPASSQFQPASSPAARPIPGKPPGPKAVPPRTPPKSPRTPRPRAQPGTGTVPLLPSPMDCLLWALVLPLPPSLVYFC